MSQAKVNKLLKDRFGLENVKIENHLGSTKTYKRNNKMVKGVYCTNHSPMDVTNIAYDRVKAKLQQVNEAVKASGLVKRFDSEHDAYVIAETKNSVTYLWLDVERLPCYTFSANMDSDYKQSYIVPRFHKHVK